MGYSATLFAEDRGPFAHGRFFCEKGKYQQRGMLLFVVWTAREVVSYTSWLTSLMIGVGLYAD